MGGGPDIRWMMGMGTDMDMDMVMSIIDSPRSNDIFLVLVLHCIRCHVYLA
jgi:hypothetical protein